MARVSIVVWAVLAGCAPKAVEIAAPPVEPVERSMLSCPAGTAPAGAAPPLGTEVWCERPTPSGKAIKEGPSIAWYPDGARKSEGSYTDGQQSGPWVTYYATGGPQRQGSYLLGKEDGPWKSYHPDGTTASAGAYVDGMKHGQWTFWGVQDAVASVPTLALVRSEGIYLFGQRDGVWLDYSADEQPIREKTYRDGQMISLREIALQ